MSFNFKDDKARAKSSTQIYDNDEGKKNLTEYSRKTERVKELLDCFETIHSIIYEINRNSKHNILDETNLIVS